MSDSPLAKDLCCPELDVNRWDDVTHEWKDKPFIKDYVAQIFHIPLNIGSVITRMFKKVQDADAIIEPVEDFMVLAYDPSPWKSELYMSVAPGKQIPGAEMTTLSGKFLSKVFDGPFNAVPQWIAEMEKLLQERGLKAEKYYFHYAYCPKCSKKYGHNYCVAFAKVG